MDNRQQIIDELEKHHWAWDSNGDSLAQDMADFIIQDRKKNIQEYKTIFFCDCDKDI